MSEIGEPNPQQQLFADYYLEQRKIDATKAAIRAGYTERSAHVTGSRLIRNVKVKNYIKKRESELVDELNNHFIFGAEKAQEVLYDILNDEDARDMDRINVAKDFLDRAGFVPTTKQEIKHEGEIGTENPMKDLTTEELRKLIDG